MLDQWLVIVSGADMNEELRKVPDSHADFLGAANDVCMFALHAFPYILTISTSLFLFGTVCQRALQTTRSTSLLFAAP